MAYRAQHDFMTDAEGDRSAIGASEDLGRQDFLSARSPKKSRPRMFSNDPEMSSDAFLDLARVLAVTRLSEANSMSE
jgi:hypothetical protein